jgi:hypothetical protein
MALFESFSSRIRMGRAIGLYDEKLAGILDTIRIVRNGFAHSVVAVTFENELIIAECEKLPAPTMPPDPAHKWSPARDRYFSACMRAMVALSLAHARKLESGPTPVIITDGLDSAPETSR